jgi:hypothetical protein
MARSDPVMTSYPTMSFLASDYIPRGVSTRSLSMDTFPMWSEAETRAHMVAGWSSIWGSNHSSESLGMVSVGGGLQHGEGS